MTETEPDAAKTERSLDRMQKDLVYLADFERLVIRLSSRFVALSASDLDAEINHALEAVGRFARVDRSYLFQFSEDGTRLSNTHEWCARDIEPMMHRLQDVPTARFHWIAEKHRREEVVHCDSLADLPPEAENERRELEREQVQSMVTVPLTCRGKVLGFAGFDSVRARKRWKEDHIKVLRLVGEMIAGAIERERSASHLAQRVEVERLVGAISTRFINVPISELDGEINRALGEIGEFTDVDRCYVFQLSADGQRMDNTHEWCARGIEPHVHELIDQPVDCYGFSMARMQRGEIFHVPRVSELPEEAAAERKEFEREGIQTLINVPIMARGTMIGFLGFDAVHQAKTWTEHDGRLLVLFGEIIANALDRKTTENRLQASLLEKEVLLREIHHRVKNNMQLVSSLLYIQSRALGENADPAALDAFRQSRHRIKSMAAVHDRLYRSDDLAAIDFGDYVSALVPDLMRSYDSGSRVRAEVHAGRIRLPIDQAIPCGLIVNELVANSLKHGFPGRREGRIEIGLKEVEDGLLALSVCDDGVGTAEPLDPEADQTFGLRLIGDLVRQLDGELELRSRRGVCAVCRFPRASS